MDTKDQMSESTRIKLELYGLYLGGYLGVLLNTPFYDEIEIIDPFAGWGILKDGQKGSAVIAAEAIAQADNQLRKPVRLRLNDSDDKKCKSLKAHLNQYSFASVSCERANTFVENLQPLENGHRLFFIDPYGYTQISPENLWNLLRGKNREFLIFMPVSHMYRFFKQGSK